MANERKIKTAKYAAIVDASGVVRVYDSVAGHYSIHHSLTSAQVRYIIARAK